MGLGFSDGKTGRRRGHDDEQSLWLGSETEWCVSCAWWRWSCRHGKQAKGKGDKVVIRARQFKNCPDCFCGQSPHQPGPKPLPDPKLLAIDIWPQGFVGRDTAARGL
jgi:hypothetical protein